MSDIDRDDIKAMRREGSLRDYLRLQMAAGRARKEPPAPTPQPRPPGHTPGAWPTGSRPPSPLPAAPPGAWTAALQRHRDGTQTGTTCDCPGCTTPHQEDQ